MTEANERMARIEADVSRLREIIDPLPAILQDVMQRGAIANERIATHLEESRRAWDLLESHDRMLVQMREQQAATCEFCSNVRKVFWPAVTGGLAVIWWAIQKWIEGHK